MRETGVLGFAPFRLDLGAERLWRDDAVVRLTAKAFAVLRYLVTHAGQLVTKNELFTAVWASSHVSEAALTMCIRELRHALGDAPQAPQFLETVRGRGYRFVAPVTRPNLAALPTGSSAYPLASSPPPLLVEREHELAHLQWGWQQAQQGRCQVVLVTGDAGLGKTALVDAFVAPVAMAEEVWLGHGQCIEQYGVGEAYLPLLDALAQMARHPDGAHLVAVLQQHAPSWLLQLPALVPETTYESLERRSRGTTRERMLRELAEAVEALTVVHPLLLVLEDLHWSDVSTLDWIAYMARRRQAARLLLVGTYRPTEAIVQEHPVHTVTRDLQLHGQSTELALGYLSPAGVATYLRRRLAGESSPEILAPALYQRTDGHPLFLVTVVDELIRSRREREGITERDLAAEIEAILVEVPETLRQLIERQLAQLRPAEQELLEVASVAGVEFAAAAVAAGAAQTVETIEAQCDALARRGQFLRACGTDDWPDGTVATRYTFRHDLYREVIYARLPAGRRGRWHRQLGERLEAGYGTQAQDIAVELAVHFMRGRHPARAVPYLSAAGEQAVQRSAHQEAISHFTQALTLLRMLPESPARTQQELQVHMALGPVLMTTKGFADPEVAQTYSRARELCQQLEGTPDLFSALWGLWQFANGSAQLQVAWELGTQLSTLAQQVHDPVLQVQAHHALWTTERNRGKFCEAYAHTEHGRRLYTSAQHGAHLARYGVDDPGVCCAGSASLLLWLLGYPDQAVHRGHEALALARELGHPFSLAYVLPVTAEVHRFCRSIAVVHEQAEAALALGVSHGFPFVVALSTVLQGWALAVRGDDAQGIAQIRQGLAILQTMGTLHLQPEFLTVLAEAYGHAGLTAEGLATVAEALAIVDTTGECVHAAELYRLQGELLLLQAGTGQGTQDTRVSEAEDCFQRALLIARGQEAKSWELRAATSLSRLWQRQGKQTAAHELLASIYGWFTEGFATADLQEAKALLGELVG
jgi:DNA-binding winged helix-turn-helix (wHTH) protein/predicted ATPase